jgi:hypothetical protein
VKPGDSDLSDSSSYSKEKEEKTQQKNQTSILSEQNGHGSLSSDFALPGNPLTEFKMMQE